MYLSSFEFPMYKTAALSFILTLYLFQGVTQNNPGSKTFLVEKLGTHQKYAYRLGDVIKLIHRNREVLHSYIWDISDSAISVGQNRPLFIKDIASVYPQFSFSQKLGKYMFIAGIAYFTVVSLNHLINNELVFSKDVFVVPTALFGAGLISVSLSQKRCKIGDRWKIKVLDIRIL